MSCHCISLSVRLCFAWRQACWQKYNSSSQTEVQKWQHTWNAVEAQLRHQSSGVSINICGKSEKLTMKGILLSRHVAMSSADYSNPDAILWASCEIPSSDKEQQLPHNTLEETEWIQTGKDFDRRLALFQKVCNILNFGFAHDFAMFSKVIPTIITILTMNYCWSLCLAAAQSGATQKIFSCNRKQKLRLWLVRNLMQYLKLTNIKLDI